MVSLFSSKVCLGVLNKNENENGDIIDIMKFIRHYVPTKLDSTDISILSFGDLLTVEREINAQEERRNLRSRKGNLEGIIPCLTDFHFLGNFLGVINFLLLYKFFITEVEFISVDEYSMRCCKMI